MSMLYTGLSIGTETAGSRDVNVSSHKDGRSVKMLTPHGEDRRNDETRNPNSNGSEGESDLETANPSHLSGDKSKRKANQRKQGWWVGVGVWGRKRSKG